MAKLKVACVQLNAGSDPGVNLAQASDRVREAATAGAELIALPEYAVLRPWARRPREGAT